MAHSKQKAFLCPANEVAGMSQAFKPICAFLFDRSHDWCSDACKVPLDVLEMYLRCRKSCYLGVFVKNLQTVLTSCGNVCQCIFVLRKKLYFWYDGANFILATLTLQVDSYSF